MVNKFKCKLSKKELDHYCSCVVNVEQLKEKNASRISLFGLNLRCDPLHKFKKGGIIKASKTNGYNEIIINDKVLRVKLANNSNSNKANKSSNDEHLVFSNNFLDNHRKSILKRETHKISSPKSVSFDDVIYINQISPKRSRESCSEDDISSNVLNGKCTPDNIEQFLNGSCDIPKENSIEPVKTVLNKTMNFDGEVPKRKRGRPKKNPDPPFSPIPAKKKVYMVTTKIPTVPDTRPTVTESGEPKKKRGRPRKKYVFGFQTVVSDIKTILLPSDLWSAHVSVTSKKSQVCFTRVVQEVSNTVPVECDRSVKFNGSINYLVKIDNRDVELLAAPKTVDSVKDIEILLQIVHDIKINDPILNYVSR